MRAGCEYMRDVTIIDKQIKLIKYIPLNVLDKSICKVFVCLFLNITIVHKY